MKRKMLLIGLILGFFLCTYAQEESAQSDEQLIMNNEQLTMEEPSQEEPIQEEPAQSDEQLIMNNEQLTMEELEQEEPAQSDEQLPMNNEQLAMNNEELTMEEPVQEGQKFSLGKFFLDIQEKADLADQAQGGKKMAGGLGLEWNMNSPDYFAGGLVLGFDYDLPVTTLPFAGDKIFPFAAGLTVTVSNNFSGVTVLEPAALFRWYFLSSGHAGFFAQVDLGAALIIGSVCSGDCPESDCAGKLCTGKDCSETGVIPMFLGGLRGGYRLPLGSSFYAEAYGRIGYPFIFGIGVIAGMRF